MFDLKYSKYFHFFKVNNDWYDARACVFTDECACMGACDYVLHIYDKGKGLMC